MISALHSGAAGIQAGLAQLDRAAQATSCPCEGQKAASPADSQQLPGPVDLPTGLVDAMLARNTVSANAALVRRADDALGSLIDVLG